MKRVIAVLFAIAAVVSAYAAGLKKSPDYGKFDAEFDKVFENVPLNSKNDELHSLVVVKDGELIYDRHDPAYSLTGRHILWSTSKSFTSLALGFAIQDGLVSLDDKIIKYFPDELPSAVSPRLAAITVRDLCLMASGFEKDYIAEMRAGKKDLAAAVLAEEVMTEPGTVHKYNTMNTYLIGMIITRATGKALDDYLNQKLFKPLGIKDYFWEKSADGYCQAGCGLCLSPESLAKAGVFMLQKGQWKGRQLLNASYIEEATSTHIQQFLPGTLRPSVEATRETNDWLQGYGYQFWTTTHNAYRMTGSFGQWVIMIPDKNAVIVTTAHFSAGQKQMNLLWEYVYPNL